ncbi:MAG: hypothetical protein LC130_04180 [Bryobacterales bacterium]|nr:hypothetical protein [Bryobacterales bacterium]
MPRENFEGRAAQVRFDRKQRALDEALLVTWSQLETAAQEYVEWHSFALWVRTVAETAGGLPDVLRSELLDRCPGFLEHADVRKRPIWNSLNEWIAAHWFGAAQKAGWFDALTYFAYKDLRVEQAWTLWARTKTAWQGGHPSQWPTWREWHAQVVGVTTLSQAGSQKARVLDSVSKVDADRLRSTVSHIIERRGFVFWVDCVARVNQKLDPAVLSEVKRQCPGIVATEDIRWNPGTFRHLIRQAESEFRDMARAEEWYPALRYHVCNHPRYHRLLHFRQRCHDEWLTVRPISLPSFRAWLMAADAYVIRPDA